MCYQVTFLCQTVKSKDVASATTQEFDFSTMACSFWHGFSLAPAHSRTDAALNLA